jgi:hypothetical protein
LELDPDVQTDRQNPTSVAIIDPLKKLFLTLPPSVKFIGPT